MKSSLLSVIKYLIVALISILLYRHLFKPISGISPVEYVSETVYVDCVEVIIDTLEIVLPGTIDTVKVIEDYHTRKEIASEYQDENIKIRIKDVLYKNNVDKRSLDYTILPRADPVKVFVTSQLYMGKNGGGIAIGLSMLKNRNQFSIGYDPITNRTFFGFNYQIKIRSPTQKKKRK